MITLRRFLIAALMLGLVGFLAEPAKAQEKLRLDAYKPLGAEVCSDVKLPCAVMVLKATDFYYAVFSPDGTKLVAITKVSPDGREETVWGELPPSHEQPSQPKSEQEEVGI